MIPYVSISHIFESRRVGLTTAIDSLRGCFFETHCTSRIKVGIFDIDLLTLKSKIDDSTQV